MKKIIFQNTETTLKIGSDDSQVTVIPIVLTDGQSTGVGILFPDGQASWWNLLISCNIIAYWRATEMIKIVSKIENDTFCCMYYAANRGIHYSDKQKRKKIVGIVGKKAYEKVMNLPIPEEIIQYILNNYNKESFNSPDLWPILKEYNAGTLEWREEFTKCGLSKPLVIQSLKRTLIKKLMNLFG